MWKKEKLTLTEVEKQDCPLLTDESLNSPLQHFGETPACERTDICSKPPSEKQL